MELKYINKEISQLATMEAVNMLSKHGKEKLKEFRYLKSLHESKVKNLHLQNVNNMAKLAEFVKQQKDLPPEINDIVSENFWDLI